MYDHDTSYDLITESGIDHMLIDDTHLSDEQAGLSNV